MCHKYKCKKLCLLKLSAIEEIFDILASFLDEFPYQWN